MKKFLNLIISILIIFNISSCKCKQNEPTLGVWWWDDSLDYSYLEFAKDNGITEIYYCNDDFNEKTSNFIKNANEMGMKVYWLTGEYKWLDDPTNLYNKINNYKNYQKEYSKQKFSGIHLDIEPHQNPNFENKRNELISKLIYLANDLKNNFSNIKFDYDLPFWLNDLIYFNNEKKEAYKHMIDIANRVFLMSYRDTSNAIYDVSSDEIKYAKNTNKILILGVETKSNEGNNVSFQEEGKKQMYNEIDNLIKLLPKNYGVSIHQIKTWYNLKD